MLEHAQLCLARARCPRRSSARQAITKHSVSGFIDFFVLADSARRCCSELQCWQKALRHSFEVPSAAPGRDPAPSRLQQRRGGTSHGLDRAVANVQSTSSIIHVCAGVIAPTFSMSSLRG